MIPSYQELNKVIQSDLDSGPMLYSLRKLFGKALVGIAGGLYRFADEKIENLMPDTAKGDYADRWAKIWYTKRKLATPARGNIGVESASKVEIPKDTEWLHSDTQLRLRSTERAVVDGKGSIKVEAVEVGLKGMLEPNETLTITSPIPGLESEASVVSLSGGSERERDEQLRKRYLRKAQLPPQGGAPHDYIFWAEDIPGVSRAWVLPRPKKELGKVHLMFIDENGVLPSEARIQEVDKILQQKKPAGSELTIVPWKTKPIDLAITCAPKEKLVLIEEQLEGLFKSKIFPFGFQDEYQNSVKSTVTQFEINISAYLVPRLSAFTCSPAENFIADESIGQTLVLGEVSLVH